MAGAVERLFGHMTEETRKNIAGLLRKEGLALLGQNQTNIGLEPGYERGEGADRDFIGRKAIQYFAVAGWFLDQ